MGLVNRKITKSKVGLLKIKKTIKTMTKEEYKNLILNNGYINTEAVIEFLRNNYIADYEVIAEIYNNGISLSDCENLQKALDEIENREIE